jgi:hypothetical protein
MFGLLKEADKQGGNTVNINWFDLTGKPPQDEDPVEARIRDKVSGLLPPPG